MAEKRRLQGDLTAAYRYLKGAYRKKGEQLFMWSDSDSRRGKVLKLTEGRFRLAVREKFFAQNVVRR